MGPLPPVQATGGSIAYSRYFKPQHLAMRPCNAYVRFAPLPMMLSPPSSHMRTPHAQIHTREHTRHLIESNDSFIAAQRNSVIVPLFPEIDWQHKNKTFTLNATSPPPAFPGCVAGAQEEPRVAAGSTYGNGFGRASCLFFTARVCGTIGTGSGALGNFGWKFICFPAGVLYIRVCVCVSCSSRRMLQIESGAMELTMGQIEQSSSSS